MPNINNAMCTTLFRFSTSKLRVRIVLLLLVMGSFVPVYGATSCLTGTGGNYCGTVNPTQSCSCDSACTTAGNCCADVKPVCFAPQINGVISSNGSFPTSGGVQITLSGNNFGTTVGTVTVAGANCPIVSWANTSISCTLPGGVGTGNPVIVSVDGFSFNIFSLNYDPPQITTISPTSAKVGSFLTLTGRNFGIGNALKVTVGIQSCAVVAVSHTSIQCVIPSGEGINQGVNVTVSGQTSNLVNFNYAAPTITSITPATMSVAGGLPTTLAGSGFGASSTVNVGGVSATITQLSYTAITFTMPSVASYTQAITVVDSNQSSPAYTYNFQSPVISSVVPSTVQPGQTLVVNGSSFLLNAAVQLGGVNCPVISQSNTSISCTVPPGNGSAVAVTVTGVGVTSNSMMIAYAPQAVSVPEQSWALWVLAIGLLAMLIWFARYRETVDLTAK